MNIAQATGDIRQDQGPGRGEAEVSMKILALILPALLMVLPSCIVTYRDFPSATLESLPKGHEPKPLYYHVEPIITQEVAVTRQQREAVNRLSRLNAGMLVSIGSGLYGVVPQVDPVGEPGYHEVASTLRASGMFSDMIDAPDKPQAGLYCYVDFEVRERSGLVKAYVAVQYAASILSMGLLIPFVMANALPYYAEEGGTAVIYTLYRDGQLQHTYSYSITKKGTGWIALLPFAWINFFTNDLKDAVRGTTLQFLIDAQRDGNL